ncbi:hypothetical protein HN903_04470 [archaeon]|jgi:uncharacterized HAD superfamily protein|nr:hypothetical protein [archaeon]MBT7128982.1 hypothetical protein [archaeon]
MKIAIDIDEVIVKFVAKYMEFVGNKGYRRVEYEDVFCYELWEVLGIEKNLVNELFDEYNNSEEFKENNFIDGACEGVCFLKEKHDISFVTARSKKLCKETRALIFEEFGILGNRVFFSGDSWSGDLKKEDVCKELGIGLIIDDSGKDSLRYAESGIVVLLLNKPWNQGFEHERIYRCLNWGEIMDKIREIDNG